MSLVGHPPPLADIRSRCAFPPSLPVPTRLLPDERVSRILNRTSPSGLPILFGFHLVDSSQWSRPGRLDMSSIPGAIAGLEENTKEKNKPTGRNPWACMGLH
jgi:hypothetical protein